MHMKHSHCNNLVEKTAVALNEDTVLLMLIAVQKNNLELSVKTALRRWVHCLQWWFDWLDPQWKLQCPSQYWNECQASNPWVSSSIPIHLGKCYKTSISGWCLIILVKALQGLGMLDVSVKLWKQEFSDSMVRWFRWGREPKLDRGRGEDRWIARVRRRQD